MTDTKKTTAIATRPANTLEAIRQEYPADKYRLCLPETRLARVPEGMILSVRTVTIDVKDPAQIYTVGGGGKALTKVALDRIAAAAGIKWGSVRRIDPRNHPHYCEFEAIGELRDFDGTVRQAIGTKTLDLRDDCGDGTPGTARASMSDREVGQARKFIAEICASKAMNRAIASVLAIPRSYTAKELASPFVFAKLVPDPDHPMAQRAVLASAFGAAQVLFGPAPAQLPDGPVVDAELETPETPASCPADSDEGGGAGGAASPPDSDYGPPEWEDTPDAEPEDVKAPGDIISEAWSVYAKHGGDPKQFWPMVAEVTGAKSRNAVDLDGAQKVLDRVMSDVMGEE